MLSGKQRSYLRGKGNQLEPVVHIGKAGVSTPVIEETDKALEDHELIKVRVLDNSGREITEVAGELAEACQAEMVQVIGSVFLLYRQHPEEPIYHLPQ